MDDVLEVTGLVKGFGDVVALDDCSFAVPRGRLVGLLGPNGAGKTTAMRSVFGLVRPDRGEVRWEGRPVDQDSWVRFGYMPEERGLYPRMRVREQLVHFARLGAPAAADVGAAADRWLARLGLAERGDARVDQLSHGNKQRLQLAVALVNDPPLLVLDEPFSGLDPLAVGTLGGLLRELAAEGVAVLFSSHQLDLVEDLCEDVVTLDSGRVVLTGALQELRSGAAVRRVDVAFAAPAADRWWESLPGADVTAAEPRRVRLLVDRGTDPERVLAQARAAGPVESFSFEPPSLSQIFRQAVRA